MIICLASANIKRFYLPRMLFLSFFLFIYYSYITPLNKVTWWVYWKKFQTIPKRIIESR